MPAINAKPYRRPRYERPNRFGPCRPDPGRMGLLMLLAIYVTIICIIGLVCLVYDL